VGLADGIENGTTSFLAGKTVDDVTFGYLKLLNGHPIKQLRERIPLTPLIRHLFSFFFF
jgi:hypothetical protein